MEKIRTLNLTKQLSNAYGQILNARLTGNILHYDKALNSYQGLLTEFLETTQRENDHIRKELDQNQKLIDAQFKYRNILKVIR